MNDPGSRELLYTLMPDWPALTWLACCSGTAGTIDVFHGRLVETGAHWFCEAGWAGEYLAGDFDRTDLVFGSGGRLRPDGLTFVSSAATVDRLHSFQRGGAAWVSNSLPCLLATVPAALDPQYGKYQQAFKSIRRGLEDYQRRVPTSAGAVTLTYYHNLVWNGTRLVEQEKPGPVRDFSSFARYRDFLVSTLQQLDANLAAPQRRHRYRMLGTISSGYDSATVVALARGCGLREAISFDQALSGGDDNGAHIGAQLGVQVSVLDRDAWRAGALPEVPFLAADAKGEDVYFQGAERHLQGRALLTGFHGDKVWGRHTRTLTPHLIRGDQSGLSLSECRLWVGFLHCPVPFLGARQIRDIHAISAAAEMAPWDTPWAYRRPICRRILEEAGIPRRAFGFRKRTASVLLFDEPSLLQRASLADYRAWRERRGGGLLRPAPDTGVWHTVPRFLRQTVGKLGGLAPGRLALVRWLVRQVTRLGLRESSMDHAFLWAADLARDRYRAGSLRQSRRSSPEATAFIERPRARLTPGTPHPPPSQVSGEA